ncbi:MAG: cytochrome b, partial [Nitratireductor sp.]|nr:cytochrome b [Nitratireductor sp.]
IVCVGLGYLGSRPAEGIYPFLSLVLTIYYFAHFLVILPVLGWVEKTKPLPASIADAILPKKAAAAPAE